MASDTPRADRKAHVGAIALATAEILVGGSVLYWAFSRGIYDESSLGTVFFLWGSLAATMGLVVPGVVLLFGSRHRWTLQILPGALLVLVLAMLILSIVTSHFY